MSDVCHLGSIRNSKYAITQRTTGRITEEFVLSLHHCVILLLLGVLIGGPGAHANPGQRFGNLLEQTREARRVGRPLADAVGELPGPLRHEHP